MTLQIAVCVKQVPNTNDVLIDKKTGKLQRKGIKSIFNPDDKHALEAALQLKDKHKDVHITVISMGPKTAKAVLEEAYSMGADRGILLTDRKFAGSDTLATSTILATCLKKLQQEQGLDLVLCGKQAIDGDTAQVGPQLATLLNYPIISNVKQLSLVFQDLTLLRDLEEGTMKIAVSLPAVLTINKNLNTPRYPSMRRIFKTYGKNPEYKVEIWTYNDLPSIEKTKIGLTGSPTRVKKTFTPTHVFHGEILKGSPTEISLLLVENLKSKQII